MDPKVDEIELSYEDEVQNSTQCSMVSSETITDYTSIFTTEEIFKSRDALKEWCLTVGKANGIVVVTTKSDNGTYSNRRPRLMLGCERAGSYRRFKKKRKINVQEEEAKEDEDKGRSNTGTKKCGCPFSLKGEKLGTDDDWRLIVICGVHNHPAITNLEGHSYAGRLTEDETSLLVNLSKSLIRPREILSVFKNNDPNNKSTIRNVYNARIKQRVIEKAGRSQMQHLLAKLREHNYIEWHTSDPDTDIIRNLFWAHPIGADMLRIFPSLLIMDCTYNTNRYRLPLLQIIGVTSTSMSFLVASAYLASEREENYTWALSKLHDMMDGCTKPEVIVTDRELALMNAIETIFPSTRHFLCRWHISKNITTKCRKLFDKPTWESFELTWSHLVQSRNEKEYNERLAALKNEYSTYPKALKYIEDNWLNPYKERFVKAWTDTCMHRGSNTSNRAESEHARLKKHLRTNQSDLLQAWSKRHDLYQTILVEIKASFEKSLSVVQHDYRPADFSELRTFVAIPALDVIAGQIERVKTTGIDASICGCEVRRTHGVPCAHEIAEYKRDGRSIPLESIHPLWRKLDLDPTTGSNDVPILTCKPEVEKVIEKFESMDTKGKVHFLKKLRELIDPQCSALMTPFVKVKTRDRTNDISTRRKPSAFEYVEAEHGGKPQGKVPKKAAKTEVQRRARTRTNAVLLNIDVCHFPIFMREHIIQIKDVEADGNCGFRAIAELIGFCQDQWDQVRTQLRDELIKHSKLYNEVYGGHGYVKRLKSALDFHGSKPAPKTKWMCIPDMGHVIASCYNVVLHTLSIDQCLTFLPLRTEPVPIETRKHITIGFINGNHFVAVFLQQGYPVPPIFTPWFRYHENCAEGWDCAYAEGISRFLDFSVVRSQTSHSSPILIDS